MDQTPWWFNQPAMQAVNNGGYRADGLPQLPQQAVNPWMQNTSQMPQQAMGRPMMGQIPQQAQAPWMRQFQPQLPQQAPQGFDQQAWGNSNFTNPQASNYVDPAGVAARIRAGQSAGNPYAAGLNANMFDGGQAQAQAAMQNRMPQGLLGMSQPPNPYASATNPYSNPATQIGQAQQQALGGLPNPYAPMGAYGNATQNAQNIAAAAVSGQPQQQSVGGQPNPYATQQQALGSAYQAAQQQPVGVTPNPYGQPATNPYSNPYATQQSLAGAYQAALQAPTGSYGR